jgi:hypothetical protein
MGQLLMSIDQLGLINRCLGVVLVALYLALGYFVLSDLLGPPSTNLLPAQDRNNSIVPFK